MRIPHTALAEDTLRNLIEEFVTREGTDYGERLFSLADKVVHVRRQLDKGSVVIVFDPHTESCHIMPIETATANMADDAGPASATGENDCD
jgi:uncharacterized protein YheU (UPF0270 family)